MKRSPLNKISKNPLKRQKRFVPIKVLKAVKDRSGGICERIKSYFEDDVIGVRCRNYSMKQPHHKLARSQGGEHTEENLIDLCFQCHYWATNNHKYAIEEGIVIPYKNYKNENKF